MDLFEKEIILFFKNLCEQNVRFILVGGLAVNYHGFNRSTGDIDVWIDNSTKNRESFIKALTQYGIEGADVFYNLPFIAGYTELMLDNGMRIDLMSDLQFFKQENFNECFELADNHELADKVNIKIIHVNTLICEKEQSQRPKDKEDAEQLKKLYR